MADLLAVALNVDYEVVIAKDGEFGRMLPNGSFTGVVGLVQRGEADIAATDLGITIERLGGVNFSYPYFMDGFTFATKKPQFSPKFLTIVYPFTIEVWTLILACLITMCFVFYVVLRKTFSFQKVVLRTFGSFLNKSPAFEPRRLSSKLLLLSWLAGCMFLTYSYTAVLLSFLTLPIRERGIRFIPELSEAIAKGEYESATYKGNYIPEVLSNSDDEVLRIIGNDVKKHLVPVSDSKIILLHQDKKTALIAPRNYITFLQSRCFISEDNFFGIIVAVPYKRSFCCVKQLGTASLRIAAAGLHKKVNDHNNFLASIRDLTPEERMEQEHEPKLSLKDMSGAFGFLIVGYILSTSAFMLEMVASKISNALKI